MASFFIALANLEIIIIFPGMYPLELSILSKVAWLGEFPSPSYSIFIPRIGQYSGSSKSVYFKSKCIPLLLAQYLEFLIM